jgi:hypothetical protein
VDRYLSKTAFIQRLERDGVYLYRSTKVGYRLLPVLSTFQNLAHHPSTACDLLPVNPTQGLLNDEYEIDWSEPLVYTGAPQ